MKRIKDRFGKLEYYNDNNISGLKVFDGEDLEYQDRMKYQTMQQNAWIQQQKYENEMKKQQEREEERTSAGIRLRTADCGREASVQADGKNQ